MSSRKVNRPEPQRSARSWVPATAIILALALTALLARALSVAPAMARSVLLPDAPPAAAVHPAPAEP